MVFGAVISGSEILNLIVLSPCFLFLLFVYHHYLTVFNPYLTNGFSHHYHLGESIFIFMGVKSDFYFLSHFSMKIL